jgi:hypothetical protein
MSDQNNTPPPPEVELKFQMHDADDGENEFCDGECV